MNDYKDIPDASDLGLELSRLNFERIEGTNFWERGDFIIRVSEKPEIFVDWEDSETEYLSLEVKEVLGSGRLVTVTKKDGSFWFNEQTVNGGDSRRIDDVIINSSTVSALGRGGEVTYSVPISGVSLLKQQGFNLISGSSSVFSKSLDDGEERVDVLVIMDEGKIRRVMKPIERRARERINSDTRVQRYYEEDVGSYGMRSTKKSSRVVLSDGTVEFTISGSEDYAGNVVHGSERLLRELNPEELGVLPIQVVIEKSGFKVGGINDTSLIRQLTELAGQSISALELRMRPGKDSQGGFLGVDEALLEVLARDNDYVLSKGLIHQQLAEPLKFAREVYEGGYGSEFTYKGKQYSMKVMAYRGMQFSPFGDGTGTNKDVVITNVTSGKGLRCSFLLPDMIERYGFYEGHETSYRLNPGDIIKVFELV